MVGVYGVDEFWGDAVISQNRRVVVGVSPHNSFFLPVFSRGCAVWLVRWICFVHGYNVFFSFRALHVHALITPSHSSLFTFFPPASSLCISFLSPHGIRLIHIPACMICFSWFLKPSHAHTLDWIRLFSCIFLLIHIHILASFDVLLAPFSFLFFFSSPAFVFLLLLYLGFPFFLYSFFFCAAVSTTTTRFYSLALALTCLLDRLSPPSLPLYQLSISKYLFHTLFLPTWNQTSEYRTFLNNESFATE